MFYNLNEVVSCILLGAQLSCGVRPLQGGLLLGHESVLSHSRTQGRVCWLLDVWELGDESPQGRVRGQQDVEGVSHLKDVVSRRWNRSYDSLQFRQKGGSQGQAERGLCSLWRVPDVLLQVLAVLLRGEPSLVVLEGVRSSGDERYELRRKRVNS